MGLSVSTMAKASSKGSKVPAAQAGGDFMSLEQSPAAAGAATASNDTPSSSTAPSRVVYIG